MKTVIVYYSTHHGNTRKVAEAIAQKHPDVSLIDVTKNKAADLSKYDCVGFASGVYGSKWGKPLLKFADFYLPKTKPVFFITTSSMQREKFTEGIEDIVKAKRCRILGSFHCQGYDTFGPLKLIGGVGKGHPDAEDLEDANKFFDSVLDELND